MTMSKGSHHSPRRREWTRPGLEQALQQYRPMSVSAPSMVALTGMPHCKATSGCTGSWMGKPGHSSAAQRCRETLGQVPMLASAAEG